MSGLSYSFGFGEINNNVTVDGAIQGYGFQPTVRANSTLTSNTYINAFYDGSNFETTIPSYSSFSAYPIIENIRENTGYTGFNFNPTVYSLSGNSSVNGYSAAGTFSQFSNGGFNGVNISPNLPDSTARYVNGIFVNLNNVTVYPGAKATAVIQDLTYESFEPGEVANNYFIEYVGGGSAGAETVSLVGNTITVQIEPDVSTASQIKAAVEQTPAIGEAVTITITGSGSNTQSVQSPVAFSGGEWAGTKNAAYFDGDVVINGNLSFNGALSIGALNAFNTHALVDGSGPPTSIHTLITNPTVPENTTVTNADLLGVNTAALFDIGNNSTVTTSFLGLAALGLPAVVSMGAGSSVDKISGAVFAISLDVGSSGGTIDTVSLCRSLAIPNGVTEVNRLYGYEFSLPFGNPANDTWAVWASVDCPSWLQGSLLIGGSAGSGNDRPVNSSVGLEIASTSKAFLNARMTSAERDALSAVAGMLLYNTTENKLQVYSAGEWVNLH